MTTDLETRLASSLHRAGDRNPVPDQDVRDVVRRVDRRVVRRRTVGAFALVFALAGGGLVVLLERGDSSPRVRVGDAPPSSTPTDDWGRPVLDSCTPSAAVRREVRGSSFTVPAAPTEVFADGARGAGGPLVAVVRPGGPVQPVDGNAGGLIANTQIGGRDASIQMNPGLQGGASWDLPDGGTALAYSRGLTADELRTFVEQIDAGGVAFPQGLQSIGTTDTARVSRSTCLDEQGLHAQITEIRGSLPSRYAELVTTTADARRFDVGDASVAIEAFAGEYDAVGTAFHEATPGEWQRLLDAFDNAPVLTTPPATTVPTTAAVAPDVAEPDGIVVPSVLGLTREEAERVLGQQLGFGVQVSFRSQAVENGAHVVEQTPAPSTRAAPGATIQLVIGT